MQYMDEASLLKKILHRPVMFRGCVKENLFYLIVEEAENHLVVVPIGVQTTGSGGGGTQRPVIPDADLEALKAYAPMIINKLQDNTVGKFSDPEGRVLDLWDGQEKSWINTDMF